MTYITLRNGKERASTRSTYDEFLVMTRMDETALIPTALRPTVPMIRVTASRASGLPTTEPI
jgi:hypothetical protein